MVTPAHNPFLFQLINWFHTKQTIPFHEPRDWGQRSVGTKKGSVWPWAIPHNHRTVVLSPRGWHGPRILVQSWADPAGIHSMDLHWTFAPPPRHAGDADGDSTRPSWQGHKLLFPPSQGFLRIRGASSTNVVQYKTLWNHPPGRIFPILFPASIQLHETPAQCYFYFYFRKCCYWVSEHHWIYCFLMY